MQKPVPHTINQKGECVLPGYEWISFSTLERALKWRSRNHRLRVAYDLDAKAAHHGVPGNMDKEK